MISGVTNINTTWKTVNKSSEQGGVEPRDTTVMYRARGGAAYIRQIGIDTEPFTESFGGVPGEVRGAALVPFAALALAVLSRS